jgi:hypothetical protein
MPRPTRSGLLGQKCDAVRRVRASPGVQRARSGKHLPQFGNTRPCAPRIKRRAACYRQRSFELECQGIDSFCPGIGIALQES